MDTPAAPEADELWFALRDLRRANSLSPAWKLLDQLGARWFTPMTTRVARSQGRAVTRPRPVVADLLFLRDTRAGADRLLEDVGQLQYRFMRGAPYRSPMTVPDLDMQRFILASQAYERPQYLMPDQIDRSIVGKKVRIIDGPLKDLEARVLKIKGARRRHLIIEIPALIALTLEMDPALLQVID